MIPRCSSRNRDSRPCGQYAVRDGRCFAHSHSLTRRAEALARERAAAKALREAADMIESERSFGAGGMIAAMSRIRFRADAVERGEA